MAVSNASRRTSKPILRLILLFLSALPLMRPIVPPLLDLPGHMGSYQIALHDDRSATLAHFYDHHWYVIGNLGVDLVMVPVGHLLGVELGTKLVILLIPVLTSLGFLLVAEVAHRRLPATALLALPFAYDYPFHYGFVNYCLGMALATLGFALWMRLADSADFRLRAIVFLLVAPMIWIAHAVAWALLCVLCGTEELWRRGSGSGHWGRALAQTILHVLPLCTPLLLMPLSPYAGPMTASGFLEPLSIAKWIVALNRDRWMIFDLASTALVLAVQAAAALRWFGLRFTPRVGWPAAALLLLYILAPQSINGSEFVAARIVPFAVVFALIAIEQSPDEGRTHRIVAGIAIAFFLARTAGTTLSFWLYDRSYREALIALDYVPQGARIATFSVQGCKPSIRFWRNARLQHLASLAIVRRGAFTNDQWTLSGLQLVSTRYRSAGLLVGDPSEVVTLEPCARVDSHYLPDALAAVPHAAFDYVWLLGVPAANWPKDAWLKPLYTTEDTALFRIVHESAK